MYHRLFVLRLEKPQTFSLTEFHDSLAKTGNVPMAKNPPDSFNKLVSLTISLNRLTSQKSDQGLACG
jgi:hypothetical protein